MSYARVVGTGHYIYEDNGGYLHFDNVVIHSDVIDIFLYKLSKFRPDELEERVKRGKQLCDEWINKE